MVAGQLLKGRGGEGEPVGTVTVLVVGLDGLLTVHRVSAWRRQVAPVSAARSALCNVRREVIGDRNH